MRRTCSFWLWLDRKSAAVKKVETSLSNRDVLLKDRSCIAY
jgi:predicted lipoprotein